MASVVVTSSSISLNVAFLLLSGTACVCFRQNSSSFSASSYWNDNALPNGYGSLELCSPPPTQPPNPPDSPPPYYGKGSGNQGTEKLAPVKKVKLDALVASFVLEKFRRQDQNGRGIVKRSALRDVLCEDLHFEFSNTDVDFFHFVADKDRQGDIFYGSLVEHIMISREEKDDEILHDMLQVILCLLNVNPVSRPHASDLLELSFFQLNKDEKLLAKKTWINYCKRHSAVNNQLCQLVVNPIAKANRYLYQTSYYKMYRDLMSTSAEGI